MNCSKRYLVDLEYEPQASDLHTVQCKMNGSKRDLVDQEYEPQARDLHTVQCKMNCPTDLNKAVQCKMNSWHWICTKYTLAMQDQSPPTAQSAMHDETQARDLQRTMQEICTNCTMQDELQLERDLHKIQISNVRSVTSSSTKYNAR